MDNLKKEEILEIYNSEEFARLNYLNEGKITVKDKKRILQSIAYNTLGIYQNIDNPRTLNEKIQWMRLYYRNQLISVCCDKYAVKEYVSREIGNEYVARLYGVYDDADEIDFDALPKQFALKVNTSAGYNIIVKDKSKLDIDSAKYKLNNWVQPWRNCYYRTFDIGYKSVKSKIIAEEYLDIASNPIEYKLFCFNGKVDFAIIDLDYFGKDPKRAFCDRNWNEVPFKFGKMPKVSLPKEPRNFRKMLELADLLATPFPFVRIDFYDVNGKIYFGELTFYSGDGVSHIRPVEWDEKLGQKIHF